MVNRLLLKLTPLIFTLITSLSVYGQKLGFDQLLGTNPDAPTTFCVPNNAQNNSALEKERINVKYGNDQWLFITTSPRKLNELIESGDLSDFHFEYAPPALLSDSARVHHFVNEVHAGTSGLPSSYTGAGVVLGFVDTGIDFRHPDFMFPDSSTRVYRYWDQTISTGPTPSYGYGSEWDSTSINNGTCLSMDNNGHGSTVAGIGSGDGSANGTNKGMAPDAVIVIVESNLSAPNWTLTVADACDYIFSVADDLGLPAVINLSLGTYLGSHDGNDPASSAIENLLEAEPGRIVVSAAGNSGNKGKYHQHTDVTADTSFVWFNNNAGGAFGPNTIFFELWSDVSEATFDFGFAADSPAPTYTLQGETAFYGAQSSLGVTIYDTIWNGGNRLATIEVYTGISGGAYYMQALFTDVDSTTFKYRFRTTGSGSYDLWSGAWLGLNNMETVLPTIGQMPDIAYYVMPDTLQTIVSSWNCSDHVISVGNFRNRFSHIDGNYNPYVPTDLTPPGKLSINSSKGPNRHDIVKPDVSASGDLSFGSAPLWALVPGYYPVLDSGRWHSRNGGTSMASPTVAGIAALYLEKCPKATYLDFKTDLLATAYADTFTGALPNYAYGNGKPHALNLLLSTNYSSSVIGPAGICQDPIDLDLSSAVTIESAIWSNGSMSLPMSTDSIGNYSAITYDDRGCMGYSDTLTIIQFAIPTIVSPIVHVGDTLSTVASDGYQWTLNGSDMIGETNPTLTVVPPFGTYTCYTVSVDGCIVETDSIVVTSGLGIEDLSNSDVFKIYPNPVADLVNIVTDFEIIAAHLVSIDGKITPLLKISGDSYDLSRVSKGTYTIVIQTKEGTYQSKITRI